MKKQKDLTNLLRAHKMRITPSRRLLLQFIVENKSRQVPLKELYEFVDRNIIGMDRSSVYRNVETFKKLNIIQELNLPTGKVLQYVLDRKVHHYIICKSCGNASRGDNALFQKIEHALNDVQGFAKANLSLLFYGYCTKCQSDPH